MLVPAAWELVRPDREPPVDRNAAGIDLVTLRAVLQGLEDV
jgi:hypothetical protein